MSSPVGVIWYARIPMEMIDIAMMARIRITFVSLFGEL